MTDDVLTEYRIEQLEGGMEKLSIAVQDLRDFATGVRMWVKSLAVVWTIAQGIIIALLIRLLG